ncbi:MAG TPA: entericidin A/B family lipoprotein [Opitutaceae bacterium]
MSTSFRRLALFLIAAAFISLAATGCQTTKGFGKDVENLGDNIQEKADN